MEMDLGICFIAVTGDKSVGKEAIMARYSQNRMEFPISNGPILTHKEISIDGTRVCVTPTMERIYQNQILYHNLKMSKGLMAVYDITSRRSFELIKVVINNLREMKKEIKIILVGNKCDLKSMREVSYEEALTYSATLKMDIPIVTLIVFQDFVQKTGRTKFE